MRDERGQEHPATCAGRLPSVHLDLADRRCGRAHGAHVSVPPLDDDARRRAALSAIEARRRRADWKVRIAAGEARLADLLSASDHDAALAGMRVTDALGALPGVGPRGVERILEQCRIAPSRRLRGLGPNQRSALVAGDWGRREPA
jgi:hypothetical protein